MTKSQIIRELTIELAAKCKLARELDRSLNDALSRNLDLNDELIRAQNGNKTLGKVAEDYKLQYTNERAARERLTCLMSGPFATAAKMRNGETISRKRSG